MQNKDLFYQLKITSVGLNLIHQYMRSCLVVLLQDNPWVLEDVNLFEDCCKFQEIAIINNQDLNDFIAEIKKLDEQYLFFDIEDLKDEKQIIEDNTWFQMEYLKLILSYAGIVDCYNDYNILPDTLVDFCEQYDLDTTTYLNQMEINHSLLKQLKKERREDYFE